MTEPSTATPESNRTVTGASIHLDGVMKQYRGQDKPAVARLDLEIEAGNIVTFVGPSGCGKTTTLKMINRLIEPTEGRILIDGRDVTHENPDKLRQSIGYVIQSGGLFPHWSVAKNIGAVRQLTVERGRDPADFSLLAFGGAGPLIAPLVAREMGLAECIVPLLPSGFSAWGMLGADIVDDFAQTDLTVLGQGDLSSVADKFKAMEAEAAASLEAQGVGAGDALMERQLELRYLGQEHALTLTVGATLDEADLTARFADAHRALYGHAMESPVQVLTTRVRGIGRTRKPTMVKADAPATPPAMSAPKAMRPAYCFARREMVDFAVYEREALPAFAAFHGPALVDEGTSVTVIHSDQAVEVNAYGHLVITQEGDAA